MSDIERVDGEEIYEEPRKKRGRPRKTEEEKAARKAMLRDADNARVIDFSPYKNGKVYEDKAASVVEGVVRDVFFHENGTSFWIDPHGGFKALPKYESPEKLVEAITKWEHTVMQKIQSGSRVIPDAEYMCAGLGISRSTMQHWQRGDMGEAFQNIITTELNRIAAVKNQVAMQGGIPPIVWATMMNNNHGYTQNQKVEVNVTARTVPSKEELINRANLLPGD